MDSRKRNWMKDFDASKWNKDEKSFYSRMKARINQKNLVFDNAHPNGDQINQRNQKS